MFVLLLDKTWVSSFAMVYETWSVCWIIECQVQAYIWTVGNFYKFYHCYIIIDKIFHKDSIMWVQLKIYQEKFLSVGILKTTFIYSLLENSDWIIWNHYKRQTWKNFVDYYFLLYILANNQFIPLIMLISVSNPIMCLCESRRNAMLCGTRSCHAVGRSDRSRRLTSEQIRFYPLNSHIFCFVMYFIHNRVCGTSIELELGYLSCMECWWKCFIHRILISRSHHFEYLLTSKKIKNRMECITIIIKEKGIQAEGTCCFAQRTI